MMNAESRLVYKLIEKGYTISCAESCTGGLVASRIVNVPDASRVLNVSFVTYANEAKIRYLDVDPAVIEAVGVVSEEVAGQMARGAALQAGAQVGAGISGVAGPSGGSPEKPVGTVCFGFYMNGRTETVTKHFTDRERNEVRADGAEFVLQHLFELLENAD
jgi:PncC family amidohydrolase